jgi:hypothetical protein
VCEEEVEVVGMGEESDVQDVNPCGLSSIP